MNAFTEPRYGFGASYEYKSPLTIGGLPLLHICGGIDPQTLRPRIAKGAIAIGTIAVGIVAIGSVACGLFTVGGASLGLLFAVGGAALGLGVSVGGFAVGSIAVGGAAIGFLYAIGGVAIAPVVLDSTRCDAALFEAARRWLGRVSLPPKCG
jgi:hypothetical protein